MAKWALHTHRYAAAATITHQIIRCAWPDVESAVCRDAVLPIRVLGRVPLRERVPRADPIAVDRTAPPWSDIVIE